MSKKKFRGHVIFDHDGYEEILFPEHPSAHSNGLIFVHTIVAEEKIGRRLQQGECTHHIDGDKKNNVPSNLMVFKTSGDHTNYHCALRNNLNFILTCIDGVCTCDLILDNDTYILRSSKCPECGGPKSVGAKMCAACRSKHPIEYASKLTKLQPEILRVLLKTESFEAIGREYGVSGNAIKKKAKQWGLYIPRQHKRVDVDTLMEYLRDHSQNDTARHFNVPATTIRSWMNYYKICIDCDGYICCDTGEFFNSAKHAARVKYPDTNPSSSAHGIIRSTKTSHTYKGLTWIYQGKNVYIKDA